MHMDFAASRSALHSQLPTKNKNRTRKYTSTVPSAVPTSHKQIGSFECVGKCLTASLTNPAVCECTHAVRRSSLAQICCNPHRKFVYTVHVSMYILHALDQSGLMLSGRALHSKTDRMHLLLCNCLQCINSMLPVTGKRAHQQVVKLSPSTRVMMATFVYALIEVELWQTCSPECRGS